MSSILILSDIDINKEIYRRVQKTQCSFMDAILDICEIKEIEPDAIAKHINKQIKDKLKEEGIGLNLLKRKFPKDPLKEFEKE